MTTLKPSRLQEGDKILVVSPSGPVTKELTPQLNKGIKVLENLGFHIELAKNVLSNSFGYSASAKEKADDLNGAFADQTVKMIIFSQGGENANSVLPLLDYSLIKMNPKIILGISDATVILDAIYSKTGLVTFHGNDVIWGFSRNAGKYEINELMTRLTVGKSGKINKNSVWKTIRPGKAEGKLLGGNATCLTKLTGTTFCPDFTNSILFLEDYGEHSSADALSFVFHHLEQVGIFKQISGLWLGHYKTQAGVAIETIAGEVINNYKFPVLKCDDFGHNTPNTVIPIGITAKIDTTHESVELLETCVS